MLALAPHLAVAQISAIREMSGTTSIDRSSPQARAAYEAAVALDAKVKATPDNKQAFDLRQQAYRQYAKACELGSRLGCEDATDLYRLQLVLPVASAEQTRTFIEPSRIRLRAILKGECGQGFVDACVDYQSGFGKEDPVTARRA